LIEQARIAAASGHTVIADTTFLDPNVRARLREAADQATTSFLGVWLHAPLALLEQRIVSRNDDASDATVSVLRQSVETDPGPGDWLLVEADEGGQALEVVRRAIETRGS
jgi:predicted kinase